MSDDSGGCRANTMMMLVLMMVLVVAGQDTIMVLVPCGCLSDKMDAPAWDEAVARARKVLSARNTKVYEPHLRALLGTDPHCCQEVVLAPRMKDGPAWDEAVDRERKVTSEWGKSPPRDDVGVSAPSWCGILGLEWWSSGVLGLEWWWCGVLGLDRWRCGVLGLWVESWTRPSTALAWSTPVN